MPSRVQGNNPDYFTKGITLTVWSSTRPHTHRRLSNTTSQVRTNHPIPTTPTNSNTETTMKGSTIALLVLSPVLAFAGCLKLVTDHYPRPLNPDHPLPIHELPKCGQQCAKKTEHKLGGYKHDFDFVSQGDWCGGKANFLRYHHSKCIHDTCSKDDFNSWLEWDRRVCNWKSVEMQTLHLLERRL